MQNIDTTLGQLESIDTEFYVSFAPSSGENNESYRITAFSHCNQNEYDDFGNCIDSVPNLCPYISLQPKNEEITELGFTQNSSVSEAFGQLNNPADQIDNWNLSIKSPCFEEECPSNYDESQNGTPLLQSQKGQTFKCDLSVETTDIPDLVKNYLEKNIIYADDFINSIEVSAVFTGETTVCTTNCFSNILFLPGMMGSRLYEDEEELWVSTSDTKHKKLILGQDGKSLNNIYLLDDTQNLTDDGDELGIVDDVFSLNIYQSFINDLRDWKEEKIINDYHFIPYDWRLSLEDIILNGKVQEENISYTNAQEFEESFILKKLEELQKSSKNGKVTIITHSNGGLIAKALVQKLKDTNNPLYEKIDKIIFIGVPQVGTPEAFISLLHGVNVGKGFIMSANRARNIALNMPTIYNLLPSQNYFTNPQIPFVLDKLITFQDKEIFAQKIAEYGLAIENYFELKNYILGGDKREMPSFEDTKNPNIGNSFLYEQAENTHTMLNNWQPYNETKIIQVAGWGEETISGLEYKEYITRKCSNGICGPKSEISYKIRKVVDGDGTVVVPSALWMQESENVERWWVDLDKYNKAHKLSQKDHKDILEISNLRNFIKSKIKDETSFIDKDNIILNNSSNLKSDESRFHFQLHSPLALGIIDNEGRYTGLDPITKEIKEEIPDVIYQQVGEVQFLSVPYGLEYILQLQGYEEGSFSLDIDKQENNEIIESASFQGIPTDSNTIATLTITENFKVGDSVLNIDNNGDKTTDITLTATLNGTTVYEEPKEEIIISSNSQENSPASGAVNIFMIAQNNKTQDRIYEERIENIEPQKNDIEKKEEVPKIKVINNKIENINLALKTEIKKDINIDLKTIEKTELELKNEILPLQASVIESNTNNSAKLPIIIVSLFLVGIIIFKFIKV
ncbi:MAG: hypothetical protein AAB636_01080 [Patescibacteria group bacterium]